MEQITQEQEIKIKELEKFPKLSSETKAKVLKLLNLLNNRTLTNEIIYDFDNSFINLFGLVPYDLFLLLWKDIDKNKLGLSIHLIMEIRSLYKNKEDEKLKLIIQRLLFLKENNLLNLIFHLSSIRLISELLKFEEEVDVNFLKFNKLYYNFELNEDLIQSEIDNIMEVFNKYEND